MSRACPDREAGSKNGCVNTNDSSGWSSVPAGVLICVKEACAVAGGPSHIANPIDSRLLKALVLLTSRSST